MARVKPTSVISHWNHMADGLQLSIDQFYNQVEQFLGAQQVKDAKTERVEFAQGGIFSAKRQYLQIRRGDNVFHVCAAPFGNGFFISWWLGSIESGFGELLASIPVVGFLFQWLIKPLTYYKMDTALMFQSVTHSSVLQALETMLSEKGLRALSETERKPVMRDFVGRIR